MKNEGQKKNKSTDEEHETLHNHILTERERERERRERERAPKEKATRKTFAWEEATLTAKTLLVILVVTLLGESVFLQELM